MNALLGTNWSFEIPRLENVAKFSCKQYIMTFPIGDCSSRACTQTICQL